MEKTPIVIYTPQQLVYIGTEISRIKDTIILNNYTFIPKESVNKAARTVSSSHVKGILQLIEEKYPRETPLNTELLESLRSRNHKNWRLKNFYYSLKKLGELRTKTTAIKLAGTLIQKL